MKNSLIKNYLYNTLTLVLNIGFPLIISPYISRVLGINNIGGLNFSLAFVNLFIVLSSLGLTSYGMREISRVRGIEELKEKKFIELLKIHVLSIAIFSTIYICVIFFNERFYSHIEILIIYLLNLVTCFGALDWYFQGIEEFRYISRRNLIIKLLTLVLIFTLINSTEDYLKYVWIIVGSNVLVNLTNLFNCKKILRNFNKYPIDWTHFFRIKIFYLQIILGSVYTFLDKIILGLNYSSEQVALYTRAYQLVGIIITIIVSFVRTISPRLSNLYLEDRKKYIELLRTSFSITTFLTLPLISGCIIYSKNLMFILGGDPFIIGYKILSCLSLLIILTTYSVFINTQISIPSNNEKNTLISNLLVAITMLSLSFTFLKYGAIGISLALVISELVGLITQIYLTRKYNSLEFIYNAEIGVYFLSTIFMIIMLNFLNRYLSINLYLDFIIGVMFGGIIYILFVLVFLKFFKKSLRAWSLKSIIKG